MSPASSIAPVLAARRVALTISGADVDRVSENRQDTREFKCVVTAGMVDASVVVVDRPVRIEPLTQFLAGLEKGNPFLFDEDCIAGARVAAGARWSVFYGESTEAAQLDPVA